MSSATNPRLKLVPTIIGLVAAAWLLVASVTQEDPAAQQELLGWSLERFFVVCILAGCCAYALASLRSDRLLAINAYLAFVVTVTFGLTELVFRTFPQLLPTSYLTSLPPEVRARIATQRGLFTGDGMLYSYRPELDLPSHPDLVIDEYGYRNPPAPESTVR